MLISGHLLWIIGSPWSLSFVAFVDFRSLAQSLVPCSLDWCHCKVQIWH